MKNSRLRTMICLLFLFFSVSVFGQGESKISVLHDYIVNNDLEAVKLLIEEDMGLLNAVNLRGSTPLAVAASKGFYEIVFYLTQKGADINRNGLPILIPCSPIISRFIQAKTFFINDSFCFAQGTVP